MICATIVGAVLGGIFAISMALAVKRLLRKPLSTKDNRELIAGLIAVYLTQSAFTNGFIAYHYGNVAATICLLLTLPTLLVLTVALLRGPSLIYWLTVTTIKTVADIIVWSLSSHAKEELNRQSKTSKKVPSTEDEQAEIAYTALWPAAPR